MTGDELRACRDLHKAITGEGLDPERQLLYESGFYRIWGEQEVWVNLANLADDKPVMGYTKQQALESLEGA